MAAKMALPAKAKMTALVWSGRNRPKLRYSPRLASGNGSWSAISAPTSIPTNPHTDVATTNQRTIWSS